MVSLSSTYRAGLLVSAFVLASVAFGSPTQRVKPPKIEAKFAKPEQDIDSATQAKLEELAKTYEKVARDNYPVIIKLLKMEKSPVTKPVRIIVTYAYDGVAGTGGDENGAEIAVSAKYALAHPKDYGMIVHEMVHVVQSYPKYDPSWLVEGIADWVRWFNYEKPSVRPTFTAEKANARGAYGVTAAFLVWASAKYNKDLVPKLSAAMHADTYKEELWKTYTGRTLDELAAEWKTSLQK